MTINKNNACFFWELCHKAVSLQLTTNSDFITDTSVSFSQVIVAVALIGDANLEKVVELTSLPCGFVKLAILYCELLELWSAESFLALTRSLTDLPEDMRQFDDIVYWTTDTFWESDLDHLPLHAYRGETVLGGVEREYPFDGEAIDLVQQMGEIVKIYSAFISLTIRRRLPIDNPHPIKFLPDPKSVTEEVRHPAGNLADLGSGSLASRCSYTET